MKTTTLIMLASILIFGACKRKSTSFVSFVSRQKKHALAAMSDTMR